MNIVVVGLGHVGLPLALQFYRSGSRVTSRDADSLPGGARCGIDMRHAVRTYLDGAGPAELAGPLRFA